MMDHVRALALVGQEIKVRNAKIKEAQKTLNSDPKYVALRKQIKDHRVARDLNIIEAHRRIVDEKEDCGYANFSEWIWEVAGISRQYATKIVEKVHLQISSGHQKQTDVHQGSVDPLTGDDVDEDEEDDEPERQSLVTFQGQGVNQFHRVFDALKLLSSGELRRFDKGYKEYVAACAVNAPTDDEDWIVPDMVDILFMQINTLTEYDKTRLYGKLGVVEQDRRSVDTLSTKPEPLSPRVERAVGLFFELPAAKHLWVKQRMAEPPLQMFRMTGPHVEWVQTFWQCSKEEQDAIREQIKITEQRNAA